MDLDFNDRLLPMKFKTHCKVFLKNDNGSNKEIRRFNCFNLRSAQFETLCEKLKILFPELQDKSFTLSYIDEDGDEISIKNDADISIALEIAYKVYDKNAKKFTLDQPILKLFVKLNQKDNLRFSRREVIHSNIICDACDNTICGFRYKCMTCEDYDLCSQCETLGLHAEHIMLRTLQPLNWSSHSDRRLLDHIKNYSKKKKKLLDYYNRESSGHETRKEKQPKRNVATKENIDEESPKRNTKLIDLTVNESPSHGCNTFMSQPCLSDNSATSAVNPLVEGWTILDKNDISPASSVSSNLDEPLENNLPTAPVTTTSATTSAATLVITPVTTSATAAPATSVIAPVTTPVITLANYTATKTATTSATKTATTSASIPATITQKHLPQSIYPPLPKELRIHHPNPRIQNALVTMISMGFSNDGGVLTHLLEIENGDINKVIDILLPRI